MKVKKVLRSICSIALAVVCCVATVSPIPTRAAYNTEKYIDFSEITDANYFSTSYGGYSIANGVFKANNAWANTYLSDAISLASDKIISFDFCLTDDNDPNHQFNVGLVNVDGTNFSGGIVGHFYYNTTHAIELLALNDTFGNPYDGWIADNVVDYFDGQKHTMTITIIDKTASFKIDGNDVLQSTAVGLEAPYLVFQATSTEYTLDNIKIESEIPEFTTLDVDFEETADADVFTTSYGGWSVADGVFKPNNAWANTYLNGTIPLEEDKEISFDFCLTDDGDPSHQFNIGLTNVTGTTFAGGIAWHFNYNTTHAVELLTLNTAYGNTYEGWIADTVVDYFDGQTHNMTITIVDKVASFKIDGNDVLQSREVGLDAPYLVFQASSTDYTIDNLKIKAVEKPETPAPEYDTLDVDFEEAEDADVFTTNYGGYSIADGVFKPNNAWANTYLNGTIPLEEDKEISFDFCLTDDSNPNHQFNVGLVNIEGTNFTGGIVGHFYYNTTHAIELLALNDTFGNPHDGWIADNVVDYFDGQTHTMDITIIDKTASFKIDGIDVLTSATVGLDAPYLVFQATSTDYVIDNLKIKAAEPQEPQVPQVPAVPEYREQDIDFDVAADADVFTTSYGGWLVADGVFKPSIAWATTYFDFKIPFSSNKEISFDFCLKNGNDKNHQFNFGFVDINGNTIGKGLSGHIYNNAVHGEMFTLNRDFSSPTGENWIVDNMNNYNDGKVHHMLIQVQNGKVKICIDKTVILQDIKLGTNSSYFILQATSTDTYVDNMKLSNKLTDISKYSVSNQNVTTQAPTAGAMGTGNYQYKEMEFDFSKATDGDAFSTNFNGWSVVDGVYKPNSEWATTYPNCLIPLNEDKEITFDFCMKDVDNKARQFNMGFVTPNGETFNTFLAAHFYQHASYGELFTLNRDFGNPIGEGWIADNMDHFNDGKVHSMMIRMKDGMVAFYIDGNEIFTEIPLNAEAAYFILQFTSPESYIDNLRISDTLTYIPDYPVNEPNPEGDETADSVEDEDLKATDGKFVIGLKEIILIVGAIVVISVGIGGVVILIKKRKGKVNE